MTRWSRSLTTEDYVAGLSAIESHISDVQKRLLVEQYYAPDRQVTTSHLAELAKVEGGYSVVNAQYGRLGRMFCESTGERPDIRTNGANKGKERLWATWSTGWRGPDGYIWQMLPEVALALQQLGWVEREESKTVATTPTAERYFDAFRAIANLTDRQIQLLRVHYHAPQRTITAKILSQLVGFARYSIANAQYGRLARLIGEQLEYRPTSEQLGTLVTFEKRNGEWHWLMRSEVAQALERLGWVDGVGVLYPEEIAAVAAQIVEGTKYRVLVNAYERDPEARRLCIESHGITCCICDFSFGITYGDVAEGFIHVHHLRPLSEVGGAHSINPVEDMRPVCPNCHAVLHRRIPAYSIEDVRGFLQKANSTLHIGQS